MFVPPASPVFPDTGDVPAATVDVDLPATAKPAGPSQKAGTLPIVLGVGKANAAGRVRVKTLSPKALAAAGASRLAFSLEQSAAAVPLDVAVDYAGFRHAFGAEWATRLAIIELPACATTTPGCAGVSDTDSDGAGAQRPDVGSTHVLDRAAHRGHDCA